MVCTCSVIFTPDAMVCMCTVILDSSCTVLLHNIFCKLFLDSGTGNVALDILLEGTSFSAVSASDTPTIPSWFVLTCLSISLLHVALDSHLLQGCSFLLSEGASFSVVSASDTSIIPSWFVLTCLSISLLHVALDSHLLQGCSFIPSWFGQFSNF